MPEDQKSTLDCAEALGKLARGDLSDWHGLPAHCGPSEMAALLNGGETEGRGLLSDNPTRFRVYQTPAQPEVLHVWIDDRGDAFMITMVSPRIEGGAPQLLRQLGPPEKKLGPEVGYHADAHQWIYASRGMTLYVRERTDEIARVSVYPPTTPDYYEQWLGAYDQPHYHPRRPPRS